MLTFTEPTKFGPAGKSENIPNFIGTKVYGPVPREIFRSEVIKARFKSVISKSDGVA